MWFCSINCQTTTGPGPCPRHSSGRFVIAGPRLWRVSHCPAGRCGFGLDFSAEAEHRIATGASRAGCRVLGSLRERRDDAEHRIQKPVASPLLQFASSHESADAAIGQRHARITGSVIEGVRSGVHSVTDFDWKQYLRFCDAYVKPGTSTRSPVGAIRTAS